MQSRQLTKSLLVLVLATFLLPTMASATEILKYSDHEPMGGMRTRFVKDVFFSAIEKESNGRVKIEGHWGGEIASGQDALRAVGETGTADMAIVVPEYAPKTLPLHQLFKSFPTGPTGDKQLVFYRRVYAEIPAFPAELEKANVVNLLFATGSPVAFFSTKPLDSLADIKGGKWRTVGFWPQDFLRNAGAIFVSMPWGEGVFKALQAGTLDGLMMDADRGYELKVHETAPHVLTSKNLWLGHVYLLVMNKNTWDRLAKEDKEAIRRAAEIAYKTLGSVMDSGFEHQVDDIKRGGGKIRVLKPGELEQWKAATKYQELQAAWVKEQQGVGVEDVGDALEKVNAMMTDVMK